MLLTSEEQFKIQDIVDRHLDDLIANIRSLVDATRIYEKESKMGTSQFRNLSSVASETDSVEVVVGWIQYQIGRASPNRGWQTPDRGNNQAGSGFGEQLITLIRQLGRLAREKASEEPPEMRPEFERSLLMALVRQMAGQLERYYVYRDKLTQQQSGQGRNER